MDNNIDLIIQNYKRLPTAELILLAKKPSALRIEIIPHLQTELLNRNEKEIADSLTSFLNNPKQPGIYNTSSIEDIVENLKARIDNGESAESIHADLEYPELSPLDRLEVDVHLKDRSLNFLNVLKEEKFGDTEIVKAMESNFNINEKELVQLKQELLNKGKRNLTTGYILVGIAIIFAIIIFTLVMQSGGSNGITAAIPVFTLLALGTGKILEGKKQIG
jgi:hypothetical protein